MRNNPGTNEPFEDGELSDDELDDVSGGISQSDLDSMSEMGEMESMRMQMLMDRKSKFQQALSNLNKKIGQTSETITQNLK